MKVKDLIEKLKAFDPDDRVGVQVPDIDGVNFVPLLGVERDPADYYRCQLIADTN